MSLEIATNASPPLTVSIPTSTPSSSSTEVGPSSLSSSLDSSQASSPTGIQQDSSTSTSTPTSASCSSLPIHHLTIKFAPLPELAPRKRRSTAPLGMAARTQLTRRRRGGTAPHSQSHSPTTAKESVVHPMWTEEEMEEHKRRQVEQRRLRSLKVSEKAVEGEGVDDPLMVLGRMVKGAGKQLWKKVSHRDRQGKEKEKGKTKSEEDAPVRLGLTTTTTNSSSGEEKTEDSPTKEREKEDEDWEDANDFSNVGQTETFLEAPYSHSS